MAGKPLLQKQSRSSDPVILLVAAGHSLSSFEEVVSQGLPGCQCFYYRKGKVSYGRTGPIR